ncbi:C4-dicarboxylate TRAP transporter substrate-binding protein [Candidatus Sordicultor fermentans]|jgi:tripartite ATP-independent transporter DctP family solute receptor|uniref:C4-dicarboxylate TRAP transporter substrate-binding protein n=1 Tax=Candidatus Sordicultor fermentans TaxID=1953203 RepID=UPI002A28FB6B|nr:C4-dicarboxylate TRAP transporter substrate-binding protein [Atribacterota bacterium]MDY0135171.1 C4-dicarboxylate TRAP transporter substrate-binding protein [Atribacterota bacterium]
MLKKLTGIIIVLAMVVGFWASVALAQEQYVLRFNHVLAPGHPYHEGFQKWAERVYERTNGGLKIEVFHSAQLGVEEDIIEQIRQGVPVGQNTDAARLGNYVPEIAVINGPYFVESIEEVQKLHESPSIQEWIDKLDKEYGLKVLSFNWVQGYRHFMTKDKEVRTPEDLKGLRIRTAPAPIWQESVRALGATPVALNFDEMYTALQQGAIDGAELVYDNVTSGNLYEVLNYISETRHFLLVNFEVISSKWFYSLPEEYQKILVEECDRAGLETSYLIEENTEKTKEIIREKGVTIIEDVDLEAFKKAGEAAYEVLGISEAKEKVYQEIGK